MDCQFKSASFEDEDVSVGVGDGEGGAVLDCGDSFLVEEAAGFAEILRSEGEAGLGAEGGDGHDLDLLTGFSGHVQIHLVVGDGFEVELVDVEVAGGGGVFHGEGDGDEFVGDAVGAEVFALIIRVEGAGQVLGVLDVLRAGGWMGPAMVKRRLPAPALRTGVGVRPWLRSRRRWR